MELIIKTHGSRINNKINEKPYKSHHGKKARTTGLRKYYGHINIATFQNCIG